MNKLPVEKIERISIDLMKLKPLEDLKGVYEFYRNSLEKFFDKNGQPLGEYFETVLCPVCGGSEFNHKVTIDNFIYNECKNCKAVYNSPRLRNEFIKQMYVSGEYKTYFQKLVVKSQALRKNVIESRKFRQLNSFFDEPGKILDIGCGSGSFLKVCQENGWQVKGIDPSHAAVQTAKQMYNIDIVQIDFENYKTKEKFDCITFWGLEHLPDPMRSIEKARALLDPHGLILFESPSAGCFLMEYICNYDLAPYRYIESARHVLFFSKKSIEYICKKYNLQLAHLESNGLDMQTILLPIPDSELNQKAMKMQQILDKLLLADHYRVFLKNN